MCSQINNYFVHFDRHRLDVFIRSQTAFFIFRLLCFGIPVILPRHCRSCHLNHTKGQLFRSIINNFLLSDTKKSGVTFSLPFLDVFSFSADYLGSF